MIDLHNIDCMEYMKGLDDNAFELAIVDPPYGIEINKSGRLGHYGGKGKAWDNETPTDDYFKELYRVSKNQIIWGANYFIMPATRCFLIWDKQQPEDVSFASCEYAWTSFDESAKTYKFHQIPPPPFSMMKSMRNVSRKRCVRNVWIWENAEHDFSSSSLKLGARGVGPSVFDCFSSFNS